MTLTDEQRARLPYQQTPAQADDVAREIRTLAAVVASVVHAAGAAAGAILDDPTKEPGQMVFIQQTRLALALDSWASHLAEEHIKIFGDVLPQFFAASWAAVQAEQAERP